MRCCARPQEKVWWCREGNEDLLAESPRVCCGSISIACAESSPARRQVWHTVLLGGHRLDHGAPSWHELVSQSVFSSPSVQTEQALAHPSRWVCSRWLSSSLAAAAVTESGAPCDCGLCGVALGTAWGEGPPCPSEVWGSQLKQSCPPDLSG